MPKYLGETNDDFADSASSADLSTKHADGEDVGARGRNSNWVYVDSRSMDNINPVLESQDKRSDQLSFLRQSFCLLFRGTVILIISLILLVFSSCHWYNADADLRSKIERNKKIIEVHPDLGTRWNAYEQILLLKERHDYLRNAFPSQIIINTEVDIGPSPKEKSP